MCAYCDFVPLPLPLRQRPQNKALAKVGVFMAVKCHNYAPKRQKCFGIATPWSF